MSKSHIWNVYSRKFGCPSRVLFVNIWSHVIVVVDLGGVLKWVQPFHKQKCQLFRNEMVTLPVKKSLTKGCLFQDVFINDGDIVELQTCVFVGRGKNGSSSVFGMVHLIERSWERHSSAKTLESPPNNLFWLAKGSGSAWPPFLPAASRENLGHPFTPSTLGPVPGSHDILHPLQIHRKDTLFPDLVAVTGKESGMMYYSASHFSKSATACSVLKGLPPCAQGIQPAPPAIA